MTRVRDDNDPIAFLPMYDWPETEWATDRLWALVAANLVRRGLRPPAALDRRIDLWTGWKSDRLLVAQTCGRPYVRDLRERVALVGTPAYAIDAAAGSYYSVIVVRRDDGIRSPADLRGRRAAVNAEHSQSGYAALRDLVVPFAADGRFFDTVCETGSHRRSIAAVASSDADVAAIDAVCWALAGRHDPEAVARLRVLCETPRLPGLPITTAGHRPATVRSQVRDAVAEAFEDLDREPAEALLIKGFADTTDATYERIVANDRAARDLGYSMLA
ncbi:MAG: PhnD/SsuA/transferrin family substrate-binding protein [Alphaproteobacteria bacterium]|nr:PhnD/SsuA/transferrin family substrate-binding protein [Alphaproteobacteria bacterium]